jgi:hypothetical protein
MIIERRDDEMQPRDGLSPSPSRTKIFTGEGMNAMGHEIDFRMRRLEAEAGRERLAIPRDGIRQHVGHALMALGRAIHGIETERVSRTALDAR